MKYNVKFLVTFHCSTKKFGKRGNEDITKGYSLTTTAKNRTRALMNVSDKVRKEVEDNRSRIPKYRNRVEYINAWETKIMSVEEI